MRPGSTARALALASVAVAAAVACGGAAGPDAVVQMALGSRSPSRCDLYTDAFYEREAGTSAAAGRSYCRRVAATLPTVRARITDVRVRGNTALVTAVASNRAVVFRLVRERGQWLIDQLAG